MIVTACVLYVIERDELSVGHTVMNAGVGVDVTHMPPTELVARHGGQLEDLRNHRGGRRARPRRVLRFDDLFYLLGDPGRRSSMSGACACCMTS